MPHAPNRFWFSLFFQTVSHTFSQGQPWTIRSCPPTSTSCIARTIRMCHHIRPDKDILIWCSTNAVECHLMLMDTPFPPFRACSCNYNNADDTQDTNSTTMGISWVVTRSITNCSWSNYHTGPLNLLMEIQQWRSVYAQSPLIDLNIQLKGKSVELRKG
jgi:hypothetical protein